MNNLLEGKSVVKITNLDSETTEDGLKQLITVLVQLKGKIRDIALIDLINGEHNYIYSYMFFEYECDAKQTAATLDGLPYRSCILKATILDQDECNEAFSLLSKIQNTKNVDQPNYDSCLKSSSCASITSKDNSQEKGCLSDAQSKDSTSFSSSASNDKLSSDENAMEKDESQSESDTESDTESENDDSESSGKPEMEIEQVTEPQTNTRNNKKATARSHEWQGRGRGRGRGRGGRAPRSGPRWNNNNNHRDRRQNFHNNTNWSHERSNQGQQPNTSGNFNTPSHFFKGPDLRQSNIQNQNYGTGDNWLPQNCKTPSNDYTPFNTNNQPRYPGFPNYSIPPPNFSSYGNQYNQQNYNKTSMVNEPNTYRNPQNLYNNESDKNINVSISWNKDKGNQGNNNGNRPNIVTESLCNTSQNQPPNFGSCFTHEWKGFNQNFQKSSNNQNTYSSYKQQPSDNADKQKTNYQSYNDKSDNRTPAVIPKISPPPSTAGRRGPPVPARIKEQQTTSTTVSPKITENSTPRVAANTRQGPSTSNITINSQSTLGGSKPPVPSRTKVLTTTTIEAAGRSSTTSTTSRALPNIDRADEAVRLNRGANMLSTRPSIADKKKTDKSCIIS
ncbi:unnamed protein product [Callosobruchus maculatus]|uniref:RRM domain-containing protein n=1 Tax=Callosobruchus maculatus TaxID=64391 RepID=A0A653DCA5_CALMS|nr:unnamed protein product [Callosobruchus maculatus]